MIWRVKGRRPTKEVLKDAPQAPEVPVADNPEPAAENNPLGLQVGTLVSACHEGDLRALAAALCALVDLGFQDPSSIDRLTQADGGACLSTALRHVLHRLTVSLRSAYASATAVDQAASTPLEQQQHQAHVLQTAATHGHWHPQPQLLMDLDALGAACLQASWFLVQLSSHASRSDAGARIFSGRIADAVAAFLCALAPEEVAQGRSPNPSGSGSSGLDDYDSRHGPDCQNGSTTVSGSGSRADSLNSVASASDIRRGGRVRILSTICSGMTLGAGPALEQRDGERYSAGHSSESCARPRRGERLGRRAWLLPHAALDAAVRNCCWSIFTACDATWGFMLPSQGMDGEQSAEPEAPWAAAVAPFAAVELAIAVGLALLPPASQASPEELKVGGRPQTNHPAPAASMPKGVSLVSAALGPSPATTAAAGDAAMPDAACVAGGEVLARVVQRWDGLEAAVVAGGALACLALMGDSEPLLAARAQTLLLSSPTLGALCEAVCRGCAPEHATDAVPPMPAASGSQPELGAYMVGRAGAGTCSGDMLQQQMSTLQSRPLTRPCNVLAAFFSSCLTSTTTASLLLNRLVSERALGWLLHAAAVPLPLRRRIVQQLLAADGSAVLSLAASTQAQMPGGVNGYSGSYEASVGGSGSFGGNGGTLSVLDAALALCHVIAAPAGCHSLLAVDGADGPVPPEPHPEVVVGQEQQGPAAAAGAQGPAAPQGLQQQGQPQPLLHGIQELGGPQVPDMDGADLLALHNGEPWEEQHAAAVAGPALLPALHVARPTVVFDSRRPVSTLPAACRLLLMSNRLDYAVCAFFGELRLAARAISERASCTGAASLGHGNVPPGLGGPYQRPAAVKEMSHSLGMATVSAGSTERVHGRSESSSGDGHPSFERALPPWAATAVRLPAPEGPVAGPAAFGPNESADGSGVGLSLDCFLRTSSPPSSRGLGGAEGGMIQGRASSGNAADMTATSVPAPCAVGRVTDVVAGVAALLECMARRGASFGSFTCLRGEGVDHGDSMSESCTMSASNGCGGASTAFDLEQPCQFAGGSRAQGSCAGSSNSGSSGYSGQQMPTANLLAPTLCGVEGNEEADEEGTEYLSVLSSSGDWLDDGSGEEAAGEAPASLGLGGLLQEASTRRRSSALGESAPLGMQRHFHWGGLQGVDFAGADGRDAMSLLSSISEDMLRHVSNKASQPDSCNWGNGGGAVAGSRVLASGGVAANGSSARDRSSSSSDDDIRFPTTLSQARGSGSGPSEPPLPQMSFGGWASGRLPPYTYFGSASLTAAALAIPVDVAAAARGVLPESGSYSAASNIAVASAAAAAAAAAAAVADKTDITSAARLAATASKRAGDGAFAKASGAGQAHFEGHSRWAATSCMELLLDSDADVLSDSEGADQGNVRPLSPLPLQHAPAVEPLVTQELFPDPVAESRPVRALALPLDRQASQSSQPQSPQGGLHKVSFWSSESFRSNSPISAAAAPSHSQASVASGLKFQGLRQRELGQQAPTAALDRGIEGAGMDDDSGLDAALGSSFPSAVQWVGGPGNVTGNGLMRLMSTADGPCSPYAHQRSDPEYERTQRRHGERPWASLDFGVRSARGGLATVLAFGEEQIEVSDRAFRALRRCSPLLYGWLSRLCDRSKPITMLQVPGLDDSANCRVFQRLLCWAQGGRQLGGAAQDELAELWRAADYLQVDDLLTGVEDELARRFAAPPPTGPAAWRAALGLASLQRHASSRLLHMCALHLMRGVWQVLADGESLAAAAAASQALEAAVAAELRDRLVAAVAVADEEGSLEG